MHRAYFSLTNHIDQPTFVNFNLNPSSLLLPLPTTIVFHSFCTSRCTASLQSDSILAAFLSSSLHRNNSVVVVVKVGGLYYSTSSYYSHYPGHTYIYFILFFIFFPTPLLPFSSHPHPQASETLVSSLPFFISLHSISEASSPSGYCGLYSLPTSLPFIQKASGLARFSICVNFTTLMPLSGPGCCCIDVMASCFPGSSSASYKTPSPSLIFPSSFSSLLSLKQKAFKPSAFEPEALKDRFPTNTGSKESYKHKHSFFCFLKFKDPTSTGLQAGGLERHSYKHNLFILPTQPDQHYPTNTSLQAGGLERHSNPSILQTQPGHHHPTNTNC